jgi:hypothetical protein
LFYLPFLRDVFAYTRLGLSFPLALSLAYEGAKTGQLQHAMFVVLFLALIMPTLVGLLLVGVPLGSLRTFVSQMRSRKMAVLYVTLCLAIGVLDAVSAQMPIVSGYRNSTSGGEYDFVSWFNVALNHTVLRYYGLLGGLLSGSLLRILVMIFTGDWAWLEKWSSYATNAQLADLNGIFAPEHGREQLNFDNSPAPAIRYVDLRVRAFLRTYWRMIPGSQAARGFLHNSWQDCRKNLDRISSANLDSDRDKLRLFPSWARALEAALEEMPRPKCLIPSPYASPGASSVIERLKQGDLAEAQPLGFGADFYSLPWTEQKNALVKRIILSASRDRTNIVILGEVCHVTGRAVKVPELIEAIGKHLPASLSVLFLVDGSDAIGNVRQLSARAPADAYVFAGNQWLMAPEPCGMVITRRTESNGASSGDFWDPALPMNEKGVVVLAGLWAGLSLWKAVRPERMFARSEELAKRFLSRVESEVVVIGEESGMEASSIATVKPRPGSQWMAESREELIRQLNSLGIHAGVVEPEPGRFWARFRFPYFLDGVDVDRAARALQKIICAERPPLAKMGAR